jgi:hypothetical protein
VAHIRCHTTHTRTPHAGFWCWDAESCAQRQKLAPYLISLAGYPAQWVGPVGIFAQNETTNALFHNVNHVYVLCVSHPLLARLSL